MFSVVFPQKTDQKYYDTHYAYVLNIFKEIGCAITFEKRDGFVVHIDGKPFLFDYADTSVPVDCAIPVFKFHCVKETARIHAFPPVSFNDWSKYRQFSGIVKYEGKGMISFRQRAYGNAKERREMVRRMLAEQRSDLVTSQIGQMEYWYEINNCFLAVFVPGFANNMLDRAQFQYMALGCCTISPRLPEYLPFGNFLIPNEHYIVCKDDYSDLMDLIEFYECCRDTCVEIGKNAKRLFQDTCTPEALVRWMEAKL